MRIRRILKCCCCGREFTIYESWKKYALREVVWMIQGIWGVSLEGLEENHNHILGKIRNLGMNFRGINSMLRSLLSVPLCRLCKQDPEM